MSQKSAKQSQDPAERRKWGKRPSYPFVDSSGVLVTKNRRRSIEIRDDDENGQPEIPTLEEEQLEGIDTAPELPAILRENEMTNAPARSVQSQSSTDEQMELKFQKWNIKLSAQETRCSLGRDQTCDLVLLNRFASRRHGRMEWRNGRFYFCDHSFNGTYIDFDDGRSTHICRDEVVLSGSGILSLGKPTNVEKDFVVRFIIS